MNVYVYTKEPASADTDRRMPNHNQSTYSHLRDCKTGTKQTYTYSMQKSHNTLAKRPQR